MKDKTKKKEPCDAAWELFEKTGNVSHYLFYKELTDK